MSTKPSLRRESIIEKARINKIIYEYLLANPIPGGSMVYPSGSGLTVVSSGAAWGTTITPSTGYLRYTGAAWEWKNEAYSLTSHTHSYAATIHNLIDTTNHPVTGLTTGHFLKATGATTYAFGAHGLTYTDVGAAAASHNQAESTITFTDIATGNATTGQHGFLPKLGGGSTNFLRADGTWAAPPTGGSMTYPSGSGIPIVVSGTSWGTTITDNSANWNTAFGWGNHASVGYVTGTPWTSMGYLTSQTSHADVVVDGDFTSQGIMLRGASSGVYSILTDNSANWNTAFGWGNHASGGYYVGTSSTIRGLLSSTATGLTYTNTTGVFSLTTGYAIPSTTSISNWNTAYGWGDHAGLYRPITYVPAHNDTTSLQGGSAGEYYHLIQEIFDTLIYVPNSGDPYLRISLPIACDYDIQAYSDFSQFPPTIWESMPVATTTSVGGIQYPGGTTTYLRADGTWTTVSSGVSDHGALTGLGDDDHTQYYNQTRGDARYSLSGHTHAESTITFTDITTGNATTLLHGYLPKLGGGTTNFLRADGTWAAPAGGSGLTQQQIEGLI